MGALYKTKLLDDSGTVLAVLENSTGEREHRRFNQAGDIQFSLPATDPKAARFLGMATRFEIWRRDQRITSGTISRRDVSGNPWTAFGLTNETLLAGIQTPGNVEINGSVSLLSDSSDLADIFEALTYDYKALSLNRSFDDNCVAEETDADTISFELEDQIALKKDAENTYPAVSLGDPAGRVCVQFSVPDGYGLFRLRWLQQVAETNEIVFRYRTSIDGGGNWTAWSSWTGQGDSQETSATQGYPLTHPVGTDTVQVQLQLLNSDTETVTEGYDDAGDPIVIYGTTPILEAVELVCRQEAVLRSVSPHGVDWPSEATVNVVDTRLHYHNGLEAMVEIAEKLGYEFYVDDDCRLHLGKQLGVERSDEIIFRAGHNMNIIQLEDNRHGMCNILTCLGAGDGLDQLRTPVVNSESVGRYGPHPDKQEWKDIETLAELEAKGREVVGTSLADPGERGAPKQTFRIQGVKDDLPPFYLGDTVRIIIPRDGVNTTGRILEVTRGPNEKGDAVDIMINRTRESAVDRIVQAIEKIPAARPGESRKPPAPTNVRATAGYERIVVQWQASVAGGYSRVHRAETKDGTYRIIYQGYDKKHVDEPLEVGTSRHYKVSVVVDGVESDLIGPVKATVAPIGPGDVDTIPPAAPEWAAVNPTTTDTIVTAQNQRLVRVHLAWEPNFEDDLKEYVIYRSDDGGATWKAIRTVPRGTERLTDADGLTVGTEYRYRLTAVDTFGNESEISEVTMITTGQNPTPTIPTTAPTVIPGARLMGVQLPGVASAADQQVLSYYLVECSTCNAGLDPDTNTYSMPAAPSWSGWATAGISGSRVMVHSGLDYSKGYRYRYKAVNNSGNESLWSSASAGHVPLKQGQQDIAYRSMIAEHINVKAIRAEHYDDVPVIDTYNALDSFDSTHPFEIPIYIDEGMTIHDVRITARGMRYRAYASGASAGGSHSHDVEIEDHTHQLGGSLQGTDTWSSLTNVSVSNHLTHSHTYDKATKASAALAAITWDSGTHTHTFSDSDTVSISISGYTATDGSSPYDQHSHSFSGSDSDSVSISGTTSSSSQSYVYGLSQGLHEHDITTTSTDTGSGGPTYHVVTDPQHYHAFDYLYPYLVTEAGGGSIPTTTSEGSHQHTLIYGIFDDATANGLPKGVDLYFANSESRNYVKVADLSEPPGSGDEFQLCKNQALSAEDSGWKWVKFTTTTRGRISAHIVIRGFQDSWVA